MNDFWFQVTRCWWKHNYEYYISFWTILLSGLAPKSLTLILEVLNKGDDQTLSCIQLYSEECGKHAERTNTRATK